MPPSDRFEHFKGALNGRCGIRVNDPYRIVFVWKSDNASNVRITDHP